MGKVKADTSKLRRNSDELFKKGKLAKAVIGYEKLASIDPKNAAWPKRIGDIYRRLGKQSQAIEAYEGAADAYLAAGFLIKAAAACKLILQLDPEHPSIADKLKRLNQERGLPSDDEIAQKKKLTSSSSSTTLVDMVIATEDGEIELEIDEIDVVSAGATEEGKQALENSVLFRGLGAGFLEAVVAESECSEFARGSLVFDESSHGDSLFVIIEGSVVVSSGGSKLAELKEGEFFGEVSLLTNQLRTAKVTAGEQGAQLFKIPSAPLLAAGREDARVVTRLLQFLRLRMTHRLMVVNPLFKQFPVSQRQDLAKAFKCIDAKEGQAIVSAGYHSGGLYVVLCGKMAVVRDDIVVAGLSAGDIFGEISLMESDVATASVVAQGRGLLLKMEAQTFREMVMMHPQVMLFINELADDRRQQLLSNDGAALL